MAISDLTVPGAALTLAPEYSLAYNQIVRPHLRFTVTRYFAERWVPTWGLHAAYLRRIKAQPPESSEVGPFGSAGGLAGRTAWLVVQCRQMIIWNHPAATNGQHTFSRPLALLTQESGLDKKKILEVLNEPLCQWFVRKKSGQYRYNEKTKTIGQDVNTYTVRMDDPLTPSDARCVFEQLAAHPVTGADPLERIGQRLSWALALDWNQPETRAQFLAEDLHAPVEPRYAGVQPLEIIDLVQLLEPGLTASADPRWEAIRRQCEALHLRLINTEDVIGGSYYFRKEWVKRIGHGQAWAVLFLRDRCFDKAGHPVRDVCSLPSYDWLAERTGVDIKSVQRWLAPADADEEASSDKARPTPRFLKLMGSKKQSDQRVAHSIWVAVRDPLTPDDQIRYAEALSLIPVSQPTPPANGGHGQNDTPLHPEEPDKVTLQGSGGTGQNDTPGIKGKWTKRHPRPATEPDKATPQRAGGNGQSDTGSQTKRHRVESLGESFPKNDSSTQKTESPLDSVASSSSSNDVALQHLHQEEDDEDKANTWNWQDLFKHTRKANPENRRKIKNLLSQIPASAYVARYLAALADLSIGNPVGLVLANLIEEAESGEPAFEAGVPFDRLAGEGRARLIAILYRLGSLETTPQAIAFQMADSAEEFEIKEQAQRYLDCFEVSAQVRHKGKNHDAAVERLRARIQRGLSELGLPELTAARPLRIEPVEPGAGEAGEPPMDSAAEPTAEDAPEVELDELGQPMHFTLMAQEAWDRTYEKVTQRENHALSPSTAAVWQKLATAKPLLEPARLIKFEAVTKRFTVAVTDQAALARWQALGLELELELSKLIHGSCKVEICATEAEPDPSVKTVAGQWEGKAPVTIWQETLGELQLELSKETFNAWLRDAALVSHGPGAFIIGVKNAYAKDWLTHRLAEPIRRALSKVVGRPMDMHFTVVK